MKRQVQPFLIYNMHMKSRTFIFLAFVLLSVKLMAQENNIIKELSYRAETETDAYKKERCRLDLYIPEGKSKFPTIVWFHGGGLEEGEKSIPLELQKKGVAVAAVNYRLSPKVQAPAYIDDAAASVAWIFHHISEYGGDPQQIYIAGHSAGGYLALMIGLDQKYLGNYQIDANAIQGIIPISGQTNTHYTIKKERGQSMEIPIIDEYAYYRLEMAVPAFSF